jgi:hypothetical protein
LSEVQENTKWKKPTIPRGKHHRQIATKTKKGDKEGVKP